MKREHAKHTHRMPGLAVAAALLAAASATAQTTQRVSLGINDEEPVLWSEHSDMTPDGKYIVFASAAWNLLGRDLDPQSLTFLQQIDRGFVDIFRRDLATGAIERISVSTSDKAPDNDSGFPCISNDGMRIAFASKSKILDDDSLSTVNGAATAGDFGWDVFVRDVGAFPKETRLISFGFGAFDVNGAGVGNQQTSKITGVGAAETRLPQISGNGKHIAYASTATNLSPYDTTSKWDVYVYDWDDPPASANKLISLSVNLDAQNNPMQGNDPSLFPSISDDGRYIAYESKATDLVENFTDNNLGHSDIFVHDRGAPDANGVFPASGGTTTLISHSVSSSVTTGDNASRFAAISGDGNWIAFVSWSSDLVSGDTNNEPDVFVCDRATGAITRVSVSTGGIQGDGPSGFSSARVAISNDGRFVSFASLASNLGEANTNDAWDIMLHDRDADENGIYDEPQPDPGQPGIFVLPIQTTRMSVTPTGGQTTLASFTPSLAIDPSTGEVIVSFQSWDEGLTAVGDADINDKQDVFVHRFQPTTTP